MFSNCILHIISDHGLPKPLLAVGFFGSLVIERKGKSKDKFVSLLLKEVFLTFWVGLGNCYATRKKTAFKLVQWINFFNQLRTNLVEMIENDG